MSWHIAEDIFKGVWSWVLIITTQKTEKIICPSLTQREDASTIFVSFLFLDLSHVYFLEIEKFLTLFIEQAYIFAFQDIVLITWNFEDQALVFHSYSKTILERARCSHCLIILYNGISWYNFNPGIKNDMEEALNKCTIFELFLSHGNRIFVHDFNWEVSNFLT